MAEFGEVDVARLLADAGIVRHRGKIVSTINNAQRYLQLIEERGSLAAFVWDFATTDQQGDRTSAAAIPSQTPSSVRLSKELKRRGWTFVGPTTMYAFMQSSGIVNDHIEGCWVREPK